MNHRALGGTEIGFWEVKIYEDIETLSQRVLTPVLAKHSKSFSLTVAFQSV